MIRENWMQVPHELHGAFITAVDKGSIRTMPNRSMPATPHPTLGALLMGDAFNMHHPLTRGGLTVVLSDIVVLRNLLRPLRDLNDAPNLCKYLESFYTLRKVMCTITSIHWIEATTYSFSQTEHKKHKYVSLAIFIFQFAACGVLYKYAGRSSL